MSTDHTSLLSGKVVIVTGAGRATAFHLACEGASGVVNDLDANLANSAVTEIAAAGGRALAIAGSIVEWDFASGLALGAVDHFRRLDGLVNNVGLHYRAWPWEEAEQRVKAHPELIEAAIEESLRLDPPVLGLFRTPKEDVELSGCPIPAGSKVMYNVASANRDPKIWPDPDTFRMDRPLTLLRKHASFATGSHTCLGARLARMEVKQVFEKLVARMPKLRIAGEAERIEGYNFWGKKYLPVRWA